MVTFHGVRSSAIGLLLVCVLGLLISSPASAQVVGATLSGTVTDNSGATVPNAQVVIRNTDTGITRNVTTDAAGFYQVPNLDAGQYEVTVTATGFKKAVQTGLTLVVGTPQQLNFALQVGEMSQSVEVTTEAPVVQLTSSSIGNLINATTVVELPLNGRDWGSLAALAPGVATLQVQMQTSATVPKGNRGYGNQMTIAGTRPQMNNYRLDGVSIVDYSGGTPASVIALTLGVDAIAEFSVTTSNHSAEYGRTSGGVINAITKSGTNQFHGDAYWFIRDEGFDARSATDRSVLPFHRNQFGGSVGGPIWKNKTFFFTNIEAFRQTRTTSQNIKTPTQDARNGYLWNPGTSAILPVGGSCPTGYVAPSAPAPAPITGLGAATPICLDAAISNFWPLYGPAPAPNSPGSPVGIVTNGIPTVGTENYYTARIDHTISSKDSVSGSFFFDTAAFTQPDPMLTIVDGNTSARTMFTASETHIFSSALVNSVRVGYSRTHMIQNNFITCTVALACDTTGTVSAIPGQPAPAIQVQGTLTNYNGGAHEPTSNNQAWNSYQLYDDAFLTKGTHSMKFGFNVENMRHDPSNIQTRNSSWFFNDMVALLQGIPNQVRLPATSYGYPQLRQTAFGVYFQDDWRIKPNLTLNLGMRYEMATVLSEPLGDVQNLVHLTDLTMTVGNPLYHNPTMRNFEPRVGFAWDPFKNGKTSVRGAFGVFDMLPLASEFFTALQQSAPSAGGLPILPASALVAPCYTGIFPVAPSPACGATPTAVLPYIESNPKRNYVMVWNASVQRQLTANTSVTIGYVGNKGVHMAEQFGTISVNKPLGFTSAGYPYWPGGFVGGVNQVGTGTNYTPGFASIRALMWDGDAHYNALEVSVDKKFSHGLQAGGSFTYGNGIDTSSATTISDPYLNSISTLWFFCKICRTGPSDFNIPKRLTANFIYDIPSPKSWGGVAHYAFDGWEVNSIITAMSGTPFSVLIGGDPQGTNSSDSPLAIYPNYTPGCNPTTGKIQAYINLSCFTLPAAPSGSSFACSNFGATTSNATGIAGTCANLQGDAGRNMLTGPALFDMDFSVMKNFKLTRISETFNLQFRAEMFNVINHPSWQAPLSSSTLFNQNGTPVGGAGNLVGDGITVPGREIQFGLKLNF